ncbi:hypothetical protein BJY04DRAFT_223123 [Aspergillus karnatakaensis]|uniref:uncharacterized protein n=1 Tax=Aspergillus karnatakaensis TaxID=1810916 RepID=UPI003CCCD8DE
MKVLPPLLSSVGLVSLVTALPQATAPPEGTIYSEANYSGDFTLTFAADGKCNYLYPSIESVFIPRDQDVFCQLFELDNCEGEGGEVIVASQSALTPDLYNGIICNVFV